MAQEKAHWVDFKKIKTQVSIVQILERYGFLEVLVRSANGDRLSGPCPIHGGTNKTHFRVSVSKNCWNCFGHCKCGGNVIDFVSKKEGVSFRDAALLIQKWFVDEDGVVPPSAVEQRPDRSLVEEETRSLGTGLMANEPTDESEDNASNKPLSFELTKLDPEHPYLRERGLTEEIIREFGLGYCSKGLLRGYIAIPIHNVSGEVVAYAGRWPGTPEEGEQKYKLPQGFKKSLELFNCHRATACEADLPLVVVEGFFDAIKLYQAGYERIVALMGSSLSNRQEEMLCSLCETRDERIILFLDGDEPGRKGQADARTRLSNRLYVRVINPGDQVQPEHLSSDELRLTLPFP